MGVGFGVGVRTMRAIVTRATIASSSLLMRRGAGIIATSASWRASEHARATASLRRSWYFTGESGSVVKAQELIRAIPDFPLPGILFRDITPLLKDKDGFKEAIDLFVDRFKNQKIDYVVGVEARGYMLGAPLAYAIGAGFIPVRKPGKLPFSKLSESYALEYGTNSLEIHADALGNGEHVVVVDDLLATGGTAAATRRLLERLGAHIDAFAFLIELDVLKGREVLPGVEVVSFIRY